MSAKRTKGQGKTVVGNIGSGITILRIVWMNPMVLVATIRNQDG